MPSLSDTKLLLDMLRQLYDTYGPIDPVPGAGDDVVEYEDRYFSITQTSDQKGSQFYNQLNEVEGSCSLFMYYWRGGDFEQHALTEIIRRLQFVQRKRSSPFDTYEFHPAISRSCTDMDTAARLARRLTGNLVDATIAGGTVVNDYSSGKSRFFIIVKMPSPT